MNNYQHTQIGHALIYPLVAVACACIALSVFMPIPRGAVLVALPIVLVVVLFWKLTISIDDKQLRASFGPGFVRRQISLDQIESCEPFRIRWWEGWGIHLSRHGWLYNVSGWDAIAIRLRNGRELAIGTDDPAGLVRALEQRRTRGM